MRYDLSIKILDPKYTDSLLVALARQGYDVYLGHDSFEKSSNETVCITVDEEDLSKTNEDNI